MSSAIPRALLGLVLVHATCAVTAAEEKRPRLRDLGVTIGVFEPGQLNAITDVRGVRVGHRTVIEGERIRTGVTAIVPHEGNVFQDKTPAAVVIGNGYGKLMGTTQIIELGEIETPILLTNTLAVAQAAEGTIRWTLAQPGNEAVRSLNAVVGETNDGQPQRHPRADDHVPACARSNRTGEHGSRCGRLGRRRNRHHRVRPEGRHRHELAPCACARWQLHGRRAGAIEFRRPADGRGRAAVEAARHESLRAAARSSPTRDRS